MTRKPTYEELEQRVNDLKKAVFNRNHTEKKIWQNRHQYESLLSNLHGITYRCFLDKNWTMIYMSSHVDQLTGYPPSDFLNNAVRTYESIIHREDSKYVDQAVNQAVELQEPWKIEYRIYHKNGTIRWVYEKGSAVTGSQGQTVYLDGFIIDITERKQAEEAQQKSEARMKALSEASFEAIFFSEKGLCIDQNKTAEEMFGYTHAEAVDRQALQWIAPDSRDKVKNHMLSNYEKPYEVNALRKDGTTFPCEIQARTATHQGHSIRITALRDISDRKQTEKALQESEGRLQQAQKMESIGTLAGGIAHDFNNILFPIMGHTEMLLLNLPEDSPLKFNLNEIYAASMRARGLVKQILTFSRQASSELKLMNIQPIVKEALKLIRSTIPATIAIKQSINSGCPAIKADPTQIHRIVMNLITNAFHAMEETGGEMNVALKEVKISKSDIIDPEMRPGRFACLTVSDTGTGIPEGIKEKIFDPFFTTKQEGKGTGMGLSVIHGIVKSAGGTIHVQSEAGKGTEFNVYLPIAEIYSDTEKSQVKEISKGGTERILLVDDEEIIITMAKPVLERMGYQVTSRTSSVEALKAFYINSEKFDIVITDLAMPKLPGDKFAIELLKIRPDIPILMFTGYSEKMSAEKARSIGIQGFLMKPVIMGELFQKIRELLDDAKSAT